VALEPHETLDPVALREASDEALAMLPNAPGRSEVTPVYRVPSDAFARM
jgi:hypothetical protein